MAKKIRESEVKNRIKKEYFSNYDWTKVVGDIDLTVCSEPQIGIPPTTFLWAETKNGTNKDIYESFIQLILTIGKARTYEKEMPPYYLGAADAEKIAFVEYNQVMHVFSKNDFNWNVTPSDHGTKEFKELYQLLQDELAKDVVIYKFAFDDKLIRSFIKKNFKEGRTDAKKQSVGKNNFTFVYYDWVKSVKDSIAVDWKTLEKAGILDCDFFLADLMSKDGMSIKDKLKVVLEKTKYKVLVKANIGGIFEEAYKEFAFKDEQKAYNQFWNRYERPPKPVYQRHILDRRDLLVPQDIREVKGSYYTPERWVRLSQEYLAKVLGEDWQEEYYVWDCAAGSGNLLRGLTNSYNVYASTLDDSDVKVMHDAIDGGRMNLIKNNVFQFDFLNDGYKTSPDGSITSALAECEKIPDSLRNILKDPEKRSKLVIYINPPYAEAGNTFSKSGKVGVSNTTTVHDLHGDLCGKFGKRELFVQFLIRVHQEIPSCVLAEFSKLKILQAPYFREFRQNFKGRLENGFLVPAYTFDNVKGNFPIGFMIWKLGSSELFSSAKLDVYDSDGSFAGDKIVMEYDDVPLLNDWFRNSWKNGSYPLGYLACNGNDFQNSNYVNIDSSKRNETSTYFKEVNIKNLLMACCYNAVRHCVAPTWLNDRDQFLTPKDSWAGDMEFQVDCLIWSIFNNSIKEKNGICDWIPYYEHQVHAPSPFNSRFMADYLAGKIERKSPIEITGNIWEQQAANEAVNTAPNEALSDSAKAVLAAGQALWQYYMTKPGISVNASFLDIRAYFQGFKTTDKGKTMMNTTSDDEKYISLLRALRETLKDLEAHIEPKIYEHGFLLK